MTQPPKLQTQDGFDQFLAQLSARLINSSTHETRNCIDEVLKALGEYTGAARCYLFELHPGGRRMSNTHEWVQPGISSHINDLQNLDQEDLPYFFKQMKTHYRFVVDDIETLPADAQAEHAEFEREGIRSVICVGLVIHNELLGFLGCDIVASPHRWSEAEVQRLGLVADMVANAMERERKHQELLTVQKQLEKANRQLERQVNQDGLTGISNRRALEERLIFEMQRAKRAGTGVAILLIDIDNFKAYNDHYGHLGGDYVLQSVATTLEQSMQRATDFVARFGGEEFAIILSVDSLAKAQQSAETALHSVSRLGIGHGYSDSHEVVTISVGGFFDRPPPDQDVESNITDFLRECDKALYKAKSDGRNRICFRSPFLPDNQV
ncbi:diguanylate cyclase domain-containing protein [Halomonadaceae bacterium KBTZ08]